MLCSKEDALFDSVYSLNSRPKKTFIKLVLPTPEAPNNIIFIVSSFFSLFFINNN